MRARKLSDSARINRQSTEIGAANMGLRIGKGCGTSTYALVRTSHVIDVRRAHVTDASNRRGRGKLSSCVMVWFATGAVLSNALCAQVPAPPQSHGHEAPSEVPADTLTQQSGAPAGDARGSGSLEKPGENDDAKLKVAVESALEDSGLTFVELKVRVENSVVHLDGAVKSRRAKRRAAMLARGVKGVSEVVNAIEVQPRFSVTPLKD